MQQCSQRFLETTTATTARLSACRCFVLSRISYNLYSLLRKDMTRKRSSKNSLNSSKPCKASSPSSNKENDSSSSSSNNKGRQRTTQQQKNSALSLTPSTKTPRRDNHNSSEKKPTSARDAARTTTPPPPEQQRASSTTTTTTTTSVNTPTLSTYLESSSRSSSPQDEIFWSAKQSDSTVVSDDDGKEQEVPAVLYGGGCREVTSREKTMGQVSEMEAILNETNDGGDAFLIRSSDLRRQLLRMYRIYETKLEALLQEGRRVLLLESQSNYSMAVFFSSLVAATRVIVCDNGRLDSADQLASVTAYIAAFWTLQKQTTKPTASQVLAVWMLLLRDCEKKNTGKILERVACPESKALILAFTAVVLSLFGFDVDCVGDEKTAKSFNDAFGSFQSLFDSFRVAEHIWYGSYNDLMGRMLGSYSRHARAAIEDGAAERETVHSYKTMRPRVLLLSNVQDFLSLVGETYQPCVPLRSSKISHFFLSLQRNALGTRSDKQQAATTTANGKAIFNDFSDDVRPIIEHLVSLAMKHGRGNCSVGDDDSVCCNYFYDGLNTFSYGFEEIFTAMEKFDKKEITQSAMLAHLTLPVCIGKLSYAEIPNEYDFVLGISPGELETCQRHALTTLCSIRDFQALAPKRPLRGLVKPEGTCVMVQLFTRCPSLQSI